MGPRMRARVPASLAMLVYLAMGVLYTEAVPPWEAPDEPWHLAYAESVAAGRIPTPDNTYEAHQPPLHYVLAAVVLRALDITHVPRAPDNPWFPFATAALWHVPDDPAVPLMRLLRTLNGLLGCLVVAFAWATACIVVPHDRWLPFTAAFLVALLPQFVFIAHTINNDIAAAVSGAVLAYGLTVWVVRPTRVWRAAGMLAIGGALAVLSKVNVLAVVLVAPLCAVLASRATREAGTNDGVGRRDRLQAWVLPLAGMAAGLAIGSATIAWFAPDLGRRIVTDALGRGTSVDPNLAIPSALAAQTVRMATSLFARLGWLNVDLPTSVYAITAAFVVAALVGLVSGWRNMVRAERLAVLVAGSVVMVCALAAVKNLLADPQPQGRFLFPALTAVALLLALGLWRLVGSRRMPYIASILSVALVTVNLYATTVALPSAYASAVGPYPPIATRVMPPERGVVAVLGGDENTVTQTLRAAGRDVERVEVAVAFASGPGSVTMTLMDDQGRRLAASQIDLDDIAGSRWLGVDVGPHGAGDAGRRYSLALALDDRAGRLGLWGGWSDPYPDGVLERPTGVLEGRDADLVLIVTGRQASTP